MFMVYQGRPTDTAYIYIFSSRPKAAKFLHEKISELRKEGAYIRTEHYGNYYRGLYNKNNLDRVGYELPSTHLYLNGFFEIREYNEGSQIRGELTEV